MSTHTSISSLSRTIRKKHVRQTELERKRLVLKEAYREYRSYIHFFNPDTATIHENLFTNTFKLYESLFNVIDVDIKDIKDIKDNEDALQAYRDAVEAWEKEVMDLNLFAKVNDKTPTIKSTFNAFVKVYETFQKVDWNRLNFS